MKTYKITVDQLKEIEEKINKVDGRQSQCIRRVSTVILDSISEQPLWTIQHHVNPAFEKHKGFYVFKYRRDCLSDNEFEHLLDDSYIYIKHLDDVFELFNISDDEAVYYKLCSSFEVKIDLEDNRFTV